MTEMGDRVFYHPVIDGFTPKADGLQLRILVVDDVRTIRATTRSILDGQGFDIDEAVDGTEALQKIKREKPHIVLMDIVMPNMDGITCCREVKRDSDVEDTKVIMVTGKEQFKHIDEAFKAGCDDYITKPINPDELLKKIDDMCALVVCKESVQQCLQTKPKN